LRHRTAGGGDRGESGIGTQRRAGRVPSTDEHETLTGVVQLPKGLRLLGEAVGAWHGVHRHMGRSDRPGMAQHQPSRGGPTKPGSRQ
jgi:hypothetical protein